ncbi:hypothetical protein tb265_25080 [Gemmatimonadetes bacterium T265]|nr:hypothetical protein tb265_25080 [Gemmatimonadetes bacterium T265]
MQGMRKPGGRQPDFLQAHVDAPGGALTMTRLAEAANYKAYRGANLRYGILADRIGRAMGLETPGIDLLVELIRPERVSNREWILVLKPAFAAAMRRVGWVE